VISSGWTKTVDKITKETILKMDDDTSIGYVLDVDIDYPEDYHDTHGHSSSLLPSKHYSSRWKVSVINRFGVRY
jgi:hypothetical protein